MIFPTKRALLSAICLLIFAVVTACAASETAELTDAEVVFTVTNITPTVFDMYNFQHGELAVTIRNTTGYQVQILDGVSFEINRNGNWISQASSIFDGNPMSLSPGEMQDVTFNWGVPGEPGEFRLVQDIIVENVPHTAYAYFTIENPNIPEDKTDITLRLYKSTQTSVTLIAVNGFRQGNVYIDGIYTLQCVNGENMRPITSVRAYDPRLAQQRIVGARQNQMYTIHFGWLHGALPPGEYVIWQTVNHRVYEGDGVWQETLTDIPVQFAVIEGEYLPTLSPNARLNMGWRDEAVGILAEVNSVGGRDINWLGQTLLVTALSSPRGWADGGQFYIGRPAGAVFDTSGASMPFEDIPEGAIIKFTFDGMVLDSLPAIIGGTIEIRVLETPDDASYRIRARVEEYHPISHIGLPDSVIITILYCPHHGTTEESLLRVVTTTGVVFDMYGAVIQFEDIPIGATIELVLEPGALTSSPMTSFTSSPIRVVADTN